MAKAGDLYRDLVGTILAALDPQSIVKTEQWITGPDGERDMDVEVRGTQQGEPHFVLVECKDHVRAIGIGFIDAFESKIRDLKPNRAIMFSNSGFTRHALKKVHRVGIELASVMKENDSLIKIQIHNEIVARRLTLAFGTVMLYPFDGSPFDFEDKWNVGELLFDEIPVVRWFSEKMKSLALGHDTGNNISFCCTFRDEPHWSCRGLPLKVAALKFTFSVRNDWVAQTIKTAVSIGYYDHLKKHIVIPGSQWYTPGVIDTEAWKPTDKEWRNVDLEGNTFQINLILTASNLPNAAGELPRIDELIAESQINVE